MLSLQQIYEIGFDAINIKGAKRDNTTGTLNNSSKTTNKGLFESMKK